MRLALFLFLCLMGRAMLALDCFLPKGKKLVECPESLFMQKILFLHELMMVSHEWVKKDWKEC